ncbi:hypothetical protein ACTXT7_011592 [Hymenolepis weldensis]
MSTGTGEKPTGAQRSADTIQKFEKLANYTSYLELLVNVYTLCLDVDTSISYFLLSLISLTFSLILLRLYSGSVLHLDPWSSDFKEVYCIPSYNLVNPKLVTSVLVSLDNSTYNFLIVFLIDLT